METEAERGSRSLQSRIGHEGFKDMIGFRIRSPEENEEELLMIPQIDSIAIVMYKQLFIPVRSSEWRDMQKERMWRLILPTPPNK